MISLFLAGALLVRLSQAEPASLKRIDGVVTAAIDRGDIPGAVVLISHRGKILYRKAFGNRAKLPEVEPMTLNTVFDLASLTKPIATASSVMLLVERGKLKLNSPVATYWPAFTGKGKENITLENLLLHTSGLIADNPVADYQKGPAKASENICDLKPLAGPGERFIYSDVNYIVLGEIVARVSGKPLDQFAAENIFRPLELRDTGFKPAAELKGRCAQPKNATANGYAAWFTIRARHCSVASPVMQDYSALPTIWQSLRNVCSMVGHTIRKQSFSLKRCSR